MYKRLDALGKLWQEARTTMIELERRYLEITQFQRMPGIGVVGAHVFSAFIQTPHRFATKQKLWRYCQLGVVERSSAGKPLVYKRLDSSGQRALSHQCWLSSLRTAQLSEVSLFYDASLRRPRDTVHARLNTQRKILSVLWTIWKNNVDYNPQLFYQAPAPAMGA